MARTTIHLERTFDASHVIPDHPGKCARLHGHTYRVQAWLAGEPGLDAMVVDFFDVKGAIDAWDHRHLNDVVDFTPTAELLAAALHAKLEALLLERADRAATTVADDPGAPLVVAPTALVRLWETPTSFAQVGDAGLAHG